MKILYVTTVGITMEFFVDEFKKLISNGHIVELACSKNWDYKKKISDLNLKRYNIPFSRSPVSPDNIRAYKQIKRIVRENHYDIVHCHTPNAGVITRLACKGIRKNGTKVIYTAHGFHFYKGAPKKNWLIYYPVERLCAYWTDVLITINTEDYALAKKKMKAKKVEYVPGVGIDLKRFGAHNIDVARKRKELGIPDGKLWLLNVGELITRKNQETLIRAVQNFSDMYLTIAGKGELEDYLSSLIIELHLESRVKLLGYRTDISELCEACDVFVFPSFQEGLSVALMEAMACGKAVICSSIRGNADLIDENGGVLFDPHNVDDLKSAFNSIKTRDLSEMGKYNIKKVKNFDLDTVLKEMNMIYDVQNFAGGGYNHLADLIKRYKLRKSLNIGTSDIVLISVGELNENKNHETVIRAIKGLNVRYLIAGCGDRENRLREAAEEAGVADRVKLLGYRNDVDELLAASDIFVFPSYREGLSVSLMETMASGLPAAASRIRGNVDLIDENGGALFDPHSINECREAIIKVKDGDSKVMGAYNVEKIKKFDLRTVLKDIKEIYELELR